MATKLDELQPAEAILLARTQAPPKKASSSTHHIAPNESLTDFVRRVRPSTPHATKRWISIHGPYPAPALLLTDEQKGACVAELTTLVDAWSDELAHVPPTDVTRQARIVSASVFALAKQYNYGSGKLLVSLSPSTVDAKWSAIAVATVQGALGCSARISTTYASSRLHIASIIVPCFWDEARMLQILSKLSELGVHVTAFKPDIFSALPGCDLRRLHLHTLLYNPTCP
ncbi:hypothetical protein SDRG_01670 [Saprolegnia diclina VS20]|uniref:Uncharacterized protein n=1 Tax=Saprolegnia diclina (strain VS20) TaxID=1156394 RepID=T0S8U0_SAPDV|nr:hypothetical protein SDRG_01670 [Saprolegnia diclina VS20]EQC41713.1 hypothetical protein SDRG_01670 [Saprolegnia diclina VS20]|eukprot:XP_008605427.1 hypothetical protein SDRG_01670 [Saprolegnia diclina VS20]